MVIYRPAIISGVCGDPLPGWIPNLNGPTGIMIGISTGVLRCLLADSSVSLDIVPVDLSVNGAIVSAWKRHNIDFNSSVYNSTLIKAPMDELYHIGKYIYHETAMCGTIWYMSSSKTTCRYNFLLQVIVSNVLIFNLFLIS